MKKWKQRIIKTLYYTGVIVCALIFMLAIYLIIGALYLIVNI